MLERDGVDAATALFSESTGRVLVSVPREDDVKFPGLCEGRGYPVLRIGVTDAASGALEVQDLFTVSLDELRTTSPRGARRRIRPGRRILTRPRSGSATATVTVNGEEREHYPAGYAAEHGSFGLVPAAYVFLFDGDRVLLQLRSNTGYYDGWWAASAAGHVESGESVFAAAVRETSEELGIVIDADDLAPLTTMHRTAPTGLAVDQRVDFFFACRTWRATPRRSRTRPPRCAGSTSPRCPTMSCTTSARCLRDAAPATSTRSRRSGSDQWNSPSRSCPDSSPPRSSSA